MLLEHALISALEGTGASFDYTGTWKNQISSEMTLVQSGDALAGTYTSADSSSGQTTIGDLVGYVDGDLISFVVHWRDFQAITAWVGQLDPKAQHSTLISLWQMTKQVAPGKEWSSINAGSDSFTR